MKIASAMTFVRLAFTGVIAGLASLSTYYPHSYWIPAVIAVTGAIGIHVVPSIPDSKSGELPDRGNTG